MFLLGETVPPRGAWSTDRVVCAPSALGVARPTLSNLLNGKASISPEMAIRLEKAFGGSADAWVRLQAAYNLAVVRKTERKIKVKRVAA